MRRILQGGEMSGRLQDEVESTVDQLLRLTLEDVALTAAAADQWLADLNEADSFEQVAAYHRCFMRELQRITACDLTRRIEIAAVWLGGSTRRSARAASPPTLAPEGAVQAASRPEESWQVYSLEGLAMLAGAMLDATSLKQLGDVLYGPDEQRVPEVALPAEAAAAAVTVAQPAAASGPAAGPLPVQPPPDATAAQQRLSA